MEISTEDLDEELKSVRRHIQLEVPTHDLEEEEIYKTDTENFKWLSATPTCDDIKGKGDPYLRKNKIFLRYADANDYLDVQFRLLREDLIRPLREGLAELLETRREPTGKRRKSVMKVYQKVQIVSWRCSQGGVIYKLQFDTSRLKRVRWGVAKRLKFGSLVCLSADQFQTMLIGTVANRNVNELCNGVVFVSFENDRTQMNPVEFNCLYEMIESPAYYEPYKHVLGVLQYLDEKELPFRRYLLNQGHGQVPPPKYLLNRSFKFDFSSAIKRVDKKSIEEEDGLPSTIKHALILDPSSWPTAEQLGLDDSQYGALRTALTKEFVVIQGPPGTGKTFIGVLIVQLLLANKCRPIPRFGNQFHNFENNREVLWGGPILIVCYTNHALDQFLEDIIKRHPWKVNQNKIVRLGGRCSSENESLKHCQLFEIMRQSSFRHEIGWTKGRLNAIEAHLTRASAFVELAREELLHEDCLKDFMSHGQFEMLTQGRLWKPSVILHWLYDSRGNAWQSSLLRAQAEKLRIEEDFDCHDEQVDWQSEQDYSKSANDFSDCKEKIRQNAFLYVPQGDIYFRSWQSLRNIHQRFQERKQFYQSNVWNLSLADRWRLYNYWVSLYVDDKVAEWQAALQKYTEKKTRLDTIRDDEHCRILAHADIIAMTTSAAASHNQLLKRVKPKIVIVEEAAEVLEAHTVASLSEDCQHLILIGDHKQLRPKPADYHLAKNYRLQVSLFERMLLNKMNCDCLTIQHRMRPEISKLLVPHIYKSLLDHSNVHEYGNIAGVMDNLFFLNHSVEESRVDEINSQSNEHEASFLAAFCKYLLNVGYSPDKITVLTMYTGQLLLLRKHFPKGDFEGVRITAVDNFQGEENDIILLSLVRSNKSNVIGFLSIPNRVCVALSRARKGLYIIGNGDLLRDVSPLWRDILDTLKSEERLVNKIPLGCHKHKEDVYHVSRAADFGEVPAYGCNYPCEYRLNCGHACGKKCHQLDPGHKDYKCMKPCLKKPERCRSDHSCPKQCHLDCGNCSIAVERTLARCQHTVKMACHKDENNFKCMEPCKKLCPAGHKCKNPCYYENCICTEPVKRILVRCKHEVSIPCNENERLIARAEQFRTSSASSEEESTMKAEAFYYCHEQCKKSCASGHPCQNKCYEACDVSCLAMTEKILPNCQHKAKLFCFMSVDYYQCRDKCEKTCPAAHQCTRRCYEACGKCEVLVTKTLPSCNHKVEISCHLDPLQYRCKQACKKLCSEGHGCIRKCDEECGNCTVQVEKTLPNCRHTQMMECHENPEDVICHNPCEKFISCGHQCQGICGASDCLQFCTVPVERTLQCEHVTKLPCSDDATKHQCREQIEVKTCEDGHTKMIDCFRKLEELSECTTLLKLTCSTGFSNHDFTVPCHTLKNTSSPIVGCPNTCNVKLGCGHLCQQKCENCVDTGTHSVCLDICNKQFPLCLHKCEDQCVSTCGPCLKPMEDNFRCPHTRSEATISMCHEAVAKCNKRCTWSCPHYACEKVCWEPCERHPCDAACGKLLRCGHHCPGFCGEPCLSKCLQCDRKEFEQIGKKLGIRLNTKSRFIILKPCSHVVEARFMDDLVKRQTEQYRPCQVDSSLILKCPICRPTARVIYCPRYNKVIKGAELLINEAKQRLSESITLKDRTTEFVKCWLRSNEHSWSIGSELMGHGKGVRLRLGSVCILYEIELLLEKFGKNLTAKYSTTLDKIGDKMVDVTPSYLKYVITGDIIMLYRIYMEVQILRLEKLIRGPKLETIVRCKRQLESLPTVETAAADLKTIWRTIEKVNKTLNVKLERHERRDDIDDYILHLNNYYDVELNVGQMSQWMCCSKGHVFSNARFLEKDSIDLRCPLCHPVHDYLLRNVSPSEEDNKKTAAPKLERTTRDLAGGNPTTQVTVLTDKPTDKRKAQDGDTSSAVTTGKKCNDHPTSSTKSDQQTVNIKSGESFGSDSSTIPKINDASTYDVTCQTANKKIVSSVRDKIVTKSQIQINIVKERQAGGRSRREPIRVIQENFLPNQETLTAARSTDSQASSGNNSRLERGRIHHTNEAGSQPKDQFWSKENNLHFKHYSVKSQRQLDLLATDPDLDWSPGSKRRRGEGSTIHEHWKFENETAEWSRKSPGRHPTYSGTYKRERSPERRVFSRRESDAESRLRPTSPLQSGVRPSEHDGPRHRADKVSSRHDGRSSRRVPSLLEMELPDTCVGHQSSRRSNRYIYIENKNDFGEEKLHQRDESSECEDFQADWPKDNRIVYSRANEYKYAGNKYNFAEEKRYQRDESSEFENSEYQADQPKDNHSRRRDSSDACGRESHDRISYSRGSSDFKRRRRQSPPRQNGSRYTSEYDERHRTNYATPNNYDGGFYRQAELSDEIYSSSSKEMYCRRPEEYEYAVLYTRDEHHVNPCYDRRSQRNLERSERYTHTIHNWNENLTGTDLDRPTQTDKTPDLRCVLTSRKVNRLRRQSTSILNLMGPDFDESIPTPSTSQVCDRPTVSYDEDFFESLTGN